MPLLGKSKQISRYTFQKIVFFSAAAYSQFLTHTHKLAVGVGYRFPSLSETISSVLGGAIETRGSIIDIIIKAGSKVS